MMYCFQIRQLKLRRALAKAKEAEADLLRTQMTFLPHQMWPVMVIREGSRWVCSFQCHPDPMQCVTAYGDSPGQACSNFDALWNASGIILEDPDSEEEEF